MRASQKIQMLESRIRELDDRLGQVTREKEQAISEITGLKQQLTDFREKVSELEAQLADRDLEQLKEEVRTKRAEYEGLKELYYRKIQEFEQSKEAKEQEFAKEEAISRYNLENEIRDNRQANQEYVAGTVKNFSDSFNYYLNQIKLLMDALGDVASQTGETLFLSGSEDLKAKIGQEMADKLRNETDDLRDGDGLVLIASSGEENAEETPEQHFDPIDAEPVETDPVENASTETNPTEEA